MTSQVFEPFILKGIHFKNKIICSATIEGEADENGLPTDALVKRCVRLAEGEAGAIILGAVSIQQNGRTPFYRTGRMESDDCIPAYRNIVEAVNQYRTPVFIQLNHAGRIARSSDMGLPTVAPSAFKDSMLDNQIHKEITETEIYEVIGNFVKAIVRSKAAGFDGVQLHLAHGQLLSSFLSPHFNKRSDKWGGNTENRFRIVREIFEHAKTLVGDYPIMVKLNAEELPSDGMNIGEAVKIARLLETAGCAAIEVSRGHPAGKFDIFRGEVPVAAIEKYDATFKKLSPVVQKLVRPMIKALLKSPAPLKLYNVKNAAIIKESVGIPVIVVGGIGRLEEIEQIISDGKADIVSMCRPFIIEPDIVRKFMKGKQTATKCLYCNFCVIGSSVGPVRCYYRNTH